MFEQSKIEIDAGVAEQVVELFKRLDRGRGGPYGTWHGARMNNNPYSWFQTTYDRVVEAVAPLTIDQWWFNCGQTGDEYRWHEHVPYKYAAVLYVQVPENSGGIEFRKHEEYQTFHPAVGDFIKFAGNLPHRVLPNASEDFRISVAFNLTGK